MAREQKTRYAILGLLTWSPMSGYDMKKLFDKSLRNFWNESFGQIYPMLARLAEEGLVTKTITNQPGKPDQHLYEITPAGRETLQSWLAVPADEPKGRVEILLKLFFGNEMPVAENVTHLHRFRQERLALLKVYSALDEDLQRDFAGDPRLPYWLMTIRCGLWVNRAFVDWCDESLQELKNMEAAEAAVGACV